MDDELIYPEDVRRVAELSVRALTPSLERDWSVPAGPLEWSCQRTLFHMGGAVFSYLTHLGGLWQQPTSFRYGTIQERAGGGDASPQTLLDVMRTLADVLAIVAGAAPPNIRAYHGAGMADRSGFLAMGCDELLLHTDDILRGFGQSFHAPDEITSRVLARLFPWAPTDSDPWETLRWGNGRQSLGDRESPGPTWLWHCAPLEEWDGTIPVDDEP